jgi:hypothetical protein
MAVSISTSTILSMLLSLAAAILLIVATSTDYWVSGSNVLGEVHSGQWEICGSPSIGKTSICSDIDTHCNICLDDNGKLCTGLDDCQALNASRVLTVLSVVFTCSATLALFVTVSAKSVTAKSIAGLINTLSGILGLISMILFLEKVKPHSFKDLSLDYSFTLFTIGWALAFVSGLLSCTPNIYTSSTAYAPLLGPQAQQ